MDINACFCVLSLVVSLAGLWSAHWAAVLPRETLEDKLWFLWHLSLAFVSTVTQILLVTIVALIDPSAFPAGNNHTASI